MACFKPLSAWRQPPSAPGEPTIVFGRAHKINWDVAKSLYLPCGRCIGCRLERSRRWAIRLMHEKQMHEQSSFVTLTYDDKYLPPGRTLDITHFQKFMKRLRKGSTGPLRFFHCGEYGERTGRPHYHMILFGEDFYADRRMLKRTDAGHNLYTSEWLSEVWGMGHANLGDVSFESAAYVARYCLKKLNVSTRSSPDQVEAHRVKYFDPETGLWRKPEYVTMSRGRCPREAHECGPSCGGIGSYWFKKFGKEVYPSDTVVMRGREMLPPPFYDKLLEKTAPDLFKRVKREREMAAAELQDHPDQTVRRMWDREQCKEAIVRSTLMRRLE